MKIFQFPIWLEPELIPGLSIRWYGLLVAFAIGLAYFLFQLDDRRVKLSKGPNDSFYFFAIGAMGAFIGSRFLGALLYQPTMAYWKRPLEIFWPFDPASKAYVGFHGMSFHGLLLGVFGFGGIYLWARKRDVLAWFDRLAAILPFASALGYLGCFINQNLYGRVTLKGFGFMFPGLPSEDLFPLKEDWVAKAVESLGLKLNDVAAYVNLPRHPSQLYEMLFEGILLGCFMWFIARRKNVFRGFAFSVYLIAYSVMHFVVEYFKQPDHELGFVLNLSGIKDPVIYRLESPLLFSMGQVLSLILLVFGIGILVWRARLERRPVLRIPDISEGKNPPASKAMGKPILGADGRQKGVIAGQRQISTRRKKSRSKGRGKRP